MMMTRQRRKRKSNNKVKNTPTKHTALCKRHTPSSSPSILERGGVVWKERGGGGTRGKIRDARAGQFAFTCHPSSSFPFRTHFTNARTPNHINRLSTTAAYTRWTRRSSCSKRWRHPVALDPLLLPSFPSPSLPTFSNALRQAILPPPRPQAQRQAPDRHPARVESVFWTAVAAVPPICLCPRPRPRSHLQPPYPTYGSTRTAPRHPQKHP